MKLTQEQLLEVRKFSLQMALGPVLADENPTMIDFDSIVVAAKVYAHFLATGELEKPAEEVPTTQKDILETLDKE